MSNQLKQAEDMAIQAHKMLEMLKKSAASIPFNVKDKKNISIDGKECSMSVMKNGNLLIEFNKTGHGDEVFKKISLTSEINL